MHELSRHRLRHLLSLAAILLAGAIRVAPAGAADFFVLSPTLVNAPCPAERSFVTLQAAADAAAASSDFSNTIHLFADFYPSGSARAVIEDAGKLRIAVDLEIDCSITDHGRRAELNGSTLAGGGPLLAVRNTDLAISRVNLFDAQDGAIDVIDAQLRLEDVYLQRNQRTIPILSSQALGGGAVRVLAAERGDTRLEIIGGVITDNSSNGSGGAILCDGGLDPDHEATILIEGDVRVQRNEAGGSGGVVHLVQNCSLEIDFGSDSARPRIEDNRAGEVGGVVGTPNVASVLPRFVSVTGADLRRNRASTGGAIGLLDGDALLVAQSLFQDNEAVVGGAIALRGVRDLSVFSSRFVGNQAGERGGAISMAPRSGQRAENLNLFLSGGCDSLGLPADQYCAHFLDNRAEAFEGEDPGTERIGGALDVEGTRVTIDRYAFSFNRAQRGPVLAWSATAADDSIERLVEVRQALLEGNSLAPGGRALADIALSSPADVVARFDQITQPDFGLDFEHSDGGGLFQMRTTRSILSRRIGDCTLAFADAGLVDSARGKWRLGAGSPAIDPNRPECEPQRRFLDLDGFDRDRNEDWGAFEFVLPPTPRPDPIFSDGLESLPPG